MPVLMLDLNDRLGRPRAEEPQDLIGTVGAEVEGDSASRFGALLRRHSIAVPQTFHLATPTLYGSSGRSRIDFVATPPSVQFSRIWRGGWHALQRRGLDVSGRAALWFVLQKYVVEAGALQQVGLSRLIGLTFSGDLGLFLDSPDKILTELVEPASEDLVSTIVVP